MSSSESAVRVVRSRLTDFGQPSPGTGGTAATARIGRLIRFAMLALASLFAILLLLAPAFGRATFLSPMWVYGLVILAVAGTALWAEVTGRMLLCVALIYFLVIDISLSIVTRYLGSRHIVSTLMPRSDVSMLARRAYQFHPLLQFAPVPNHRDGNSIRHTEFGTRAVEVNPSPSPSGSIALLGGSSTFDISVKQGETWADRLQELLPQYRVWNFGVPSYTSVEHIIQTAWYLPEAKIGCAVYYFGWNDIRNNFLPGLDPAYANFHLLGNGNGLHSSTDLGVTASMRLVRLLASRFGVYPSTPSVFLSASPKKGFDPTFERFVRRNVATLIALNKSRGVKMAFIGQLLHYSAFAQFQPGSRLFGAAAVEDRDIPSVLDAFNAIVADEAGRHGVRYIAPQQSWLAPADYSDLGHFTPSGSRKFAERVVDGIRQACGGS